MGNIELGRRRTGRRESARLVRDRCPVQHPHETVAASCSTQPLDPVMTTAPGSAAMAYFDGLLATDLIETADLTLDPGSWTAAGGGPC